MQLPGTSTEYISPSRTRSIASLVIDILFIHYNGITCLDRAESKELRTAYAHKMSMFNGLKPSDDIQSMLDWGRRENIVRAYRLARHGYNVALAKKLATVINTLPALERRQIEVAVGGIDLPIAKKEIPMLLYNQPPEDNKVVNTMLECEFGCGQYRLIICEDAWASRARFCARMCGMFAAAIARLGGLLKVDHLVDDKLLEMPIVCDESVDGLRYVPERNVLMVSPQCVSMTNAGLGLEVSREALVFLQHMHQAPQDLRLLKEMHKRAIGSEIYVAIVDVVRCAVADMLAVALQPKVALDKAIERRSVLLIGKIVSHLQRKRGMSVDGATRLCLKVGMGWLVNEPVVNRFVHFFKEWSRYSYHEVVENLLQLDSQGNEDKLDKEPIVTLLHSIMCNGIIDIDPFLSATEDLQEHLKSNFEASARTELQEFVRAYREHSANDSSPAKVMAYILLNLNDMFDGVCKSHEPWIRAALSGEKKQRGWGKSLFGMSNACTAELCDYIESGLAAEFAERRRRLNRFKRSVASGKGIDTIQKDMFEPGEHSAARRWNRLVKALAGEKDSLGLPKLAPVIERLRSDIITRALLEEKAGYFLADLVGRYSPGEVMMIWLNGSKRRKKDEAQDYLGCMVMSMIYSTPALLKKQPETKLGLFAELYFVAEEEVLAILTQQV